jgi:hypothetical protein
MNVRRNCNVIGEQCHGGVDVSVFDGDKEADG